MADYRRLKVWQASRRLSIQAYRATARFPFTERFGLSSQMRRAAVSVVANIAEGAGRGSERELTRFLWIARGSLTELAAEIVIARDLGYLVGGPGEELAERADEVGRLLTGLLKSRGAALRGEPPRTPQQPSTIDHRPLTKDYRLTTNDQRPTTND